MASKTVARLRDDWLLAHPEFPKERPSLIQAWLMGLVQAAQSWHVHTATANAEGVTEGSDAERTKQIIATECTNAALVSALFITITVGPVFDVEGMPNNGMADRRGITNIYYSLFIASSLLFAMSIIYSITLLIVIESLTPPDALKMAHALGTRIHWPLQHFVGGVLLLLAALLVKAYWDVSFWTWISGLIFITFLLMAYFSFLARSVQVQWDIMASNLVDNNPTVAPVTTPMLVTEDVTTIAALPTLEAAGVGSS